MKRITFLLSSTTLTLLVNSTVNASSFSLYHSDTVSALGNFGAGIAAEAADASTAWYNPAGLPLLETRQLLIGAVGIFPTARLTGTSTYSTPPLPNYVETFNDIEGARRGFVPSLYYAHPYNDCLTFGLSFVGPFGLTTEWGAAGPVRYEATTSKFFTADLSPEVGYAVNNNFSIGAGVDVQYARVTLDGVIGSPAVLQAFGVLPTAFDSRSNNLGNSYGVGFHAGVMLLSEDHHSRLGLNYQSQMQHKFKGRSHLRGRLASATLSDPLASFDSDNLTSNRITLPDIITLSGYHDLNECVALLASVVFTHWSTLSEIQLNNAAVFNPFTGTPAFATVTTPLDYKNSWSGALGVNYHMNEKLMWRVGGGYDQTPTNDRFRDVRVPDCNRFALSVGAHYQAQPSLGVDFGYTHIFQVGSSTINNTQILGESTYNVHARIKDALDLVGLQVSWSMDAIPAPMMTK